MTPDTLRDSRARLGLTQAQLAARLSVSTRTVVRWEQGDATVPRGYEAAIGLLDELAVAQRVIVRLREELESVEAAIEAA